jgi:hypothetical protein
MREENQQPWSDPEKRECASVPVTARAFPNFRASVCDAKPPEPELRVSRPSCLLMFRNSESEFS